MQYLVQRLFRRSLLDGQLEDVRSLVAIAGLLRRHTVVLRLVLLHKVLRQFVRLLGVEVDHHIRPLSPITSQVYELIVLVPSRRNDGNITQPRREPLLGDHAPLGVVGQEKQYLGPGLGDLGQLGAEVLVHTRNVGLHCHNLTAQLGHLRQGRIQQPLAVVVTGIHDRHFALAQSLNGKLRHEGTLHAVVCDGAEDVLPPLLRDLRIGRTHRHHRQPGLLVDRPSGQRATAAHVPDDGEDIGIGHHLLRAHGPLVWITLVVADLELHGLAIDAASRVDLIYRHAHSCLQLYTVVGRVTRHRRDHPKH